MGWPMALVLRARLAGEVTGMALKRVKWSGSVKSQVV